MSSDRRGKFIFHDIAGKRWPRTRRLVVLSGLLVFLALILFVQSIFIAPRLPSPFKLHRRPEMKRLLRERVQTPTVPNWGSYERTAAGMRRKAIQEAQLHPGPARPGSAMRVGYYVSWDPSSVDDLLAHADKLTHIVPEWFTLTDFSETLNAESDPQLLQILNGNKNLNLMPLLTNLSGDERVPEPVENLVHGPVENQDKFIADLLRKLAEIKAAGVVIDWEQVDPAYRDDLTAFLEKLATSLHEAGLQLWLQVEIGDALRVFDLESLEDDVDFFVAILHDQCSDTDPPGPIAGQDWFNGWLDTIGSYGTPDQWIIAIGNYGYDWKDGAKHAETLSFADAMSRAAYTGGTSDCPAPSFNPTFSYTLSGVNHTVWFLDAITFLNQTRAANAAGHTGLAITRLGTEDAALWTALDFVTEPALKPSDLARLENITPGNQITHVGEGEIVTVDNSPEPGNRRVRLEPGGRVSGVYETFPQYACLYHQGAGGEHEVALTFDDGPDPKWTPKILDILKEKGAPAAFLLVGQQVEDNPGIVERILAEGHEIGNHTYYHTNLSLCPDWQTAAELNATQRLIEDVTGRSTTFFRPPYNADSRPNDIAELKPLAVAQKLGYLTLLEDIDPEDWARPGADVILQRVKQLRHSGSIVLLHDAGGDRSQTVEALPKIIDYLRARGDTIVPVGKLLGLERDDVNPFLEPGDQPMARWVSNVVFRLMHMVYGFLWAFMVVATVLIVGRTVLVITLALRQRRKSPPGRREGTGSHELPGVPQIVHRDVAAVSREANGADAPSISSGMEAPAAESCELVSPPAALKEAGYSYSRGFRTRQAVAAHMENAQGIASQSNGTGPLEGKNGGAAPSACPPIGASLPAEPAPFPLSVIIPAYNEAKVVAATVRSVLDTDYAGEVEVLVIDDGSKDDTAAVVERIASDEPRVRLIRQPNSGKSVALARGTSAATHDILIFLDADTLFRRDTLRELVAPFADPNVGAVSGHARVGNPRTFIARCQALEYICGFNLDRRAYDYWNCITVVPGAISALRRTAQDEAGGFNADTLAEDTDLTLTLHRHGWRIAYAANAIAYTEAPETIRGLAKQRFRWCFGTMQCLWKHRELLFNPKFGALGFFSLPSIWFFQIGLVALTPLVDLILVASLFTGNGKVVLPYLVVFLLLDQILATLACVLEKEPLWHGWIMLPMRLIYRPLLSWVVWKSIIVAAKGVLVGWGKLERTASVSMPTHVR